MFESPFYDYGVASAMVGQNKALLRSHRVALKI